MARPRKAKPADPLAERIRTAESQYRDARRENVGITGTNQATRMYQYEASIGTRYGEPFASREPIGLGGLRDVI